MSVAVFPPCYLPRAKLWSSELNSPIPVHFSSLIPRMLMFTLAISCLTTSNFPWFMNLTFQVPMQYCSLQHQTFLLSLVTSTAGYCFCFGSIPSFFLELFLHWSPVAYWALTDLGSSPFSILSSCFFMLFMGSQGKNMEVVCHSLLQWTTFCQTSPPWPAPLGLPCELCIQMGISFLFSLAFHFSLSSLSLCLLLSLFTLSNTWQNNQTGFG